MWHWDQGHLDYFQFDALRAIAVFVKANDFRLADRKALLATTGLPFAAPDTHSPWRQYSRVLKLSLLVSEAGGIARPTPVADALSRPGAVTCDEYLHFLVRATTDPSPALSKWRPNAKFRYPLLFALKFLLAKRAIRADSITKVNAIIGAYVESGFDGTEDEQEFAAIIA